MMSLTNEEVDRIIAVADELKRQQRERTTCRVVVLLRGKEYASNRFMRDRYFIVAVPKEVDAGSIDNFLQSQRRFPLFWEMMMSGKYEAARATQILSDKFEEIEEIT